MPHRAPPLNAVTYKHTNTKVNTQQKVRKRTYDKRKLVQPPTFRECKDCLILQMKKTASLPVDDLSTGVCVYNHLHVSICAFADGLHKNQTMHLGRSG